jgi:hypothetical protein
MKTGENEDLRVASGDEKDLTRLLHDLNIT